MVTTFSVRRYVLIVFVLLASCSKESGFIFPERQVKTSIVKPDSVYSYSHYVSTGSSQKLYTGRNREYSTMSLLHFIIPDTLSIDSFSIIMKGDSVSDTFFVMKAIKPWEENSVTYDSLASICGDTVFKQFISSDSLVIKFGSSPDNDEMTNGFIIGSSNFYKFGSRESDNKPSIHLFNGSSFEIKNPDKDAYVVGIDSSLAGFGVNDTMEDTLLIGSGIGVDGVVELNLDSLPPIPLDSILYSRFDIGVYSPQACTLEVLLKRGTQYYAIGSKSLSGNVEGYISILPIVPYLSDTLPSYSIILRNKYYGNNIGRFTIPTDSVAFYIMYIKRGGN